MKESTTITITSGAIIKTIMWIGLFAVLLYLHDLVITLLVAVVLASAAELPVRAMMKVGVSRTFAVSFIFLVLISILAAIAFVFIPPLADDIAKFIQTIPKILESVRIFGKDMGFKDLSLALSDISRDISKGQILTVLKNTLFGSSGFFATTSVFLSGVFNLVITFVLAFYLALEDRGVQKFLRLLSPIDNQNYIEDLWERAQRKIGLWMQGQLLLSLIISLLIYVPMLILDIPYASLIAIFAFIGELIPMVGLLLALIPALVLAWTYGGVTLLGIVALVFFVVAQLENHILYPRIMNKLVGVPSVVVIIALIIGAQLAGIWGVLLSVPFAAFFMELANDLEKRKHHGKE